MAVAALAVSPGLLDWGATPPPPLAPGHVMVPATDPGSPDSAERRFTEHGKPVTRP